MIAIIMIKPNFSNAATEYKYSDTEQGIEWAYELDKNDNVINLWCTTKSKIGKVEISSCPYCEGTDIRYGYQSGDCRLYGASGFLDNQEPIHHLVCAECGAIIFTWVTNPRK